MVIYSLKHFSTAVDSITHTVLLMARDWSNTEVLLEKKSESV